MTKKEQDYEKFSKLQRRAIDCSVGELAIAVADELEKREQQRQMSAMQTPAQKKGTPKELENPIYGYKGLMEFLGVSHTTVANIMRSGMLAEATYRCGSRNLMFDRAKVLELMKETSRRRKLI